MTASDVELVGRGIAFGRFSDNHSEHWAKAWGWDNTSEIFESSPSLINACFMGKTIALLMKISGNFQRASRVAVTPPSTEFSIGTTAASQLL